jgi:hypothetical protein
VVDDFGVKYTNKKDIDHLIDSLKTDNELTKDWDGDLYCGIKLKWDYNARTLDISMPGYIIKQLKKYKHASPTRPQHCPYTPEPKQYGSDAQRPLPKDTSPPLSKEDIKHVQRVIGSILYYARAVNLTVLMALSTIASEQAKGTESTMEKTKQLLDYLATNPDATIRFHASDIILNIHSDASYLSAAKSAQQSLRSFFHGMESRPHENHQIKWGILYAMRNFKIRRRVRRRSRIRGAIPHLQANNNFLTHARRNGTSATTNVGTLRQLHGGRHHQ